MSLALDIGMGKKAEPENRDLLFEFLQRSTCLKSISRLKTGTSSASSATSGCRLSTSTVNLVEAALARTVARTHTVTSASVVSRSPGNTAQNAIGVPCQTIDAIREKFPVKIWGPNPLIRLSLRNQLVFPRKLVNLRRNEWTLPKSKRK